MTAQPGTVLHRFAARLLPAATVERFVDPAVADLQHEYAAALARSRWRARAIRVADTVRLLQVIGLLSCRYGLTRGWEHLFGPNQLAGAITSRTMAIIGAFTCVIASLMAVAIALMTTRSRAFAGAELQIAVFSLLSGFDAGAMQFGFMLALLIALVRTPARRLKVALLLGMTVLFSAVSIYAIGVTLSPPVLSRMTLADHAVAFVQPGDARSMLFAYGTRIAAGVSPLLFCVLAFALGRRVRIAVAFPAAVSVYAAYLAWFTWLRQPLIASSLPIGLAVWAPDAAIVISTLLLSYAARTQPGPAAA
ncbi:MAG TPA: hypothetical protein VG871_04075 [Vicinamibacterales bacterium]|nr:hypothetical protein [Vicinamibacterales bacterium]